MGKKTPDTDPRIGNAAEQAQDISSQEWDWFKNQYIPQQTANQGTVQSTSNDILSQYMNTLAPGQEAAYGNTQGAANATTDQALQQMQTQGQTGDQIFNSWNSSYAPLYGQIASEAAAKGGQADQDQQAMMARGDVAQSFANAAGQNERYLAQYGMSPTSGVSQAMNRTSGINQAAQEASAQTAARQAASNLGWTYRQQAADIGNGLLSAGNAAYTGSQNSGLNAINSQAGVLNAGNALGQTYTGALNTATAPVSSAATGAQGVAQGASTSASGMNQSTTGLAQQEGVQAQAGTAAAGQTQSMIGTGVGIAATVGIAI